MKFKSLVHLVSAALIITMLLVTMPVPSVYADSSGPNNPGVGANVTGVGTRGAV